MHCSSSHPHVYNTAISTIFASSPSYHIYDLCYVARCCGELIACDRAVTVTETALRLRCDCVVMVRCALIAARWAGLVATPGSHGTPHFTPQANRSALGQWFSTPIVSHTTNTVTLGKVITTCTHHLYTLLSPCVRRGRRPLVWLIWMMPVIN